MTLQLIEAGLPVLLVVNIMDEAERHRHGDRYPAARGKARHPGDRRGHRAQARPEGDPRRHCRFRPGAARELRLCHRPGTGHPADRGPARRRLCASTGGRWRCCCCRRTRTFWNWSARSKGPGLAAVEETVQRDRLRAAGRPAPAHQPGAQAGLQGAPRRGDQPEDRSAHPLRRAPFGLDHEPLDRFPAAAAGPLLRDLPVRRRFRCRDPGRFSGGGTVRDASSTPGNPPRPTITSPGTGCRSWWWANTASSPWRSAMRWRSSCRSSVPFSSLFR